jgi:DHA1 family multidrug resistance protein-like MFS transporter
MSEAGPAGRSPARVVLPLGIGTGLSIFGDSTMYTVLPLRAAEIGVSLASVGILLGINRLVRIASNSVAGHLYDRLRKRRLFLLSLIVGSLSTLMYSFTWGFLPLLLARVLWGLAWSGIAIGSADIILTSTGAAERGKWMGIYEICFLVGSAAGSLLGGLLTDLLGYRWAMGINAAISFLGIVPVFALLPDVGRKKTALHARTAGAAKPWGAGVYLAAGMQGLSRLLLAGILSSVISLLIRDRLAGYLAVVGASTLTGVINVLRTGASVASASGFGWIADRMRDRWITVSLSMTFGFAGLLLTTRSIPIVFVTGLLLCSVTSGSISVLTRVLVGDLASAQYLGKAVSAIQTAGDIGSAVGPPLAFLLIERADYSIILSASAAMFGFATALVLALRKRMRPAAI